MSEITIRELKGQEMLEVMFPLLVYCFMPSPPFPEKDEWLEKYIQPREGITYVAVFEDGAPVTGASSKAMTQQVRGAIFNMSAIWGVTTLPQARRKGYVKQAMGLLLKSVREAGQPLSTLYPFRESFYERLGYVTFPGPLKVTLDPSNLQPLLQKNLAGEVELSLIGDAYEVYRALLGEVQKKTPGFAVPSVSYKPRMDRRPSWLAVARMNGRPVGMMVYKLVGEDIGDFKMVCSRMHYTSKQAMFLLLQWVARHADQASEAELWLAPGERPETWLPDLKVKSELLNHIPMGRVVDVSEIGGMQIGAGSFSTRISDRLCSWNEGIWKFESVDGLLKISPGKLADCDLDIQAVSALVYGTNDPEEFSLRGWGQPPLEVQATMRQMFSPQLAYLGEIFQSTRRIHEFRG